MSAPAAAPSAQATPPPPASPAPIGATAPLAPPQAGATLPRKKPPLRWILVATIIIVGGGALAFRGSKTSSPSPEPEAHSASSSPTGTKHPRKRRPLKEPALKGDAFQHYYELAAVGLDLKKEQERALHAWAKNPASAVPAFVSSAQRASGRALLLLEQGTKAERADGDRRLNATLGMKAVTLGRLNLARGRIELDGGARLAACEHALAVVRFSQDVLGSDTPEASLAGATLENDSVTALEACLERPGWTREELKALRELLTVVLESVAAPPKSEDEARVVERANARLAALPKTLERLEAGLKEKTQ